MAGSRYAYVRAFELEDTLLPSTFLLIRLDGKGFHAFSKAHNFDKPNDAGALSLMNAAARRTMQGKELQGECVLAIGESDEFSFLFKRNCKLHGRRASKLLTLVTSLFTSAYIFLWSEYFPNSPLQLDQLPIFDGRIVQYTTELEVRDYLRWRQVDTHINNMYNTCFWSLVLKGGLTAQEANKELSGTISNQKQELLWSRFGINYNSLPEMFRKGSILLWEEEIPSLESLAIDPPPIIPSVESELGEATQGIVEISPPPEVPNGAASVPAKKIRVGKKTKTKRVVVAVHEDLINDAWWETGRGAGILS